MPFDPAVLDPGGARLFLDLVSVAAISVILGVWFVGDFRRRSKLTQAQRDAEDRPWDHQ